MKFNNSGIAGKIQVTKRNSITGEITGEYEFYNTFTDYGLEQVKWLLTGYQYYNNNSFPRYLIVGEGRHSDGKTETKLKAAVASSINTNDTTYIRSRKSSKYVGDVLTVNVRYEFIIGSQQRNWKLRELGLHNYWGNTQAPILNNYLLFTYSLVRDSFGNLVEIDVADIEILIISYSLQYQFYVQDDKKTVYIPGSGEHIVSIHFPPKTFPHVSRICEHDPYTTSVFGYASFNENTFTVSGAVSPINANTTAAKKSHWSISQLNNGIAAIGSASYSGLPVIIKIDPPIQKDNTQIFEAEAWLIPHRAEYIEWEN